MFLTAGFAEPFSIVAFNHIYFGSSVAEHNACAFGRSPQIMVCVCAYAVDVALFFFYYPEIVVNAQQSSSSPVIQHVSNDR